MTPVSALALLVFAILCFRYRNRIVASVVAVPMLLLAKVALAAGWWGAAEWLATSAIEFALWADAPKEPSE
jgi:hypothetical protein